MNFDLSIEAPPDCMARKLATRLSKSEINAEQFEAEIVAQGVMDITPTNHPTLGRMFIFPDDSMIIMDRRFAPKLIICGAGDGYRWSDLVPLSERGRPS